MDYECEGDKINGKSNSKSPVGRRGRGKTSKEPILFTPPEEIGLYHYNIKKPFKSFRKIYAHSDKSLESIAAIDDVNEKLKEKASDLGANAVIRVGYEQGILTLFRGIRGIGQAVYIKDLENVEKTNPQGTAFYMIMGFFWVIIGLFGFNDYHQFLLPIGISMIIYGVFNRLGYINKTFFLAFLGIIIVSGLILGKYILKNGIQLFNFDFYFSTGIFAMLLIFFIYSYTNRKNDPNISWKDEWGI